MEVGIGGVFLTSGQPERLAAWYHETFGIKFEQHDGSFAHTFGMAHIPRSWTVFSIMPARSPVPTMPRNGPEEHYGDQPVMVNMRVSDMEEFLRTCKETIEGKETHAGIGEFLWIRDPDGNRVEVWEPATPSTQMV